MQQQYTEMYNTLKKTETILTKYLRNQMFKVVMAREPI